MEKTLHKWLLELQEQNVLVVDENTDVENWNKDVVLNNTEQNEEEFDSEFEKVADFQGKDVSSSPNVAVSLKVLSNSGLLISLAHCNISLPCLRRLTGTDTLADLYHGRFDSSVIRKGKALICPDLSKTHPVSPRSPYETQRNEVLGYSKKPLLTLQTSGLITSNIGLEDYLVIDESIVTAEYNLSYEGILKTVTYNHGVEMATNENYDEDDSNESVRKPAGDDLIKIMETIRHGLEYYENVVTSSKTTASEVLGKTNNLRKKD
ncbi:hypothetical protein Trydic_g5231 [Trypoxylus dichotomus]